MYNWFISSKNEHCVSPMVLDCWDNRDYLFLANPCLYRYSCDVNERPSRVASPSSLRYRGGMFNSWSQWEHFIMTRSYANLHFPRWSPYPNHSQNPKTGHAVSRRWDSFDHQIFCLAASLVEEVEEMPPVLMAHRWDGTLLEVMGTCRRLASTILVCWSSYQSMMTVVTSVMLSMNPEGLSISIDSWDPRLQFLVWWLFSWVLGWSDCSSYPLWNVDRSEPCTPLQPSEWTFHHLLWSPL